MANVLDNTTNASFIPTIIAQKALGAFAGYMNLAKTVARDFDFTPATEGATIKVAKRGAVSANSKTAGSSVTYQNPTATDVSVTLDNHWEVTFVLDDVTKVLQNQDTLNGYAEDAAIALAEKVETTILALHPSITNTVTLDTSSATTQENSFLKVRERLVLNKVPQSDRKYGYMHPSVITRLLQIDRFTRADAYGKSGVIAEGALGRIGGIDIFESQLVPSTGSPVAYHNLVYTRNAIILAARPLPLAPAGMGARQEVINDPNINMGLRVTSSYDHDLLSMKITLDVLFGCALLDTRNIVEFESF
jgi:N4-gp56 family major capsid protein